MENAPDSFGWLLLVVAFAAAGCDRSEPPRQSNPDEVRAKVGATSLHGDNLRSEYGRLQAEVAEALRAAKATESKRGRSWY